MLLFEFYKFLSGTLIIGYGCFLGYSIVSMWVYPEQKQIAAEITEEELLEKVTEEYVTKYLEDYNDAESELLDDNFIKSLKKITITEDTPLGIVKMYYSFDDQSFVYWSDKQVPYKVLESVSRKYVTDNNCKGIHYDMENEIETKKQELLEAVPPSQDENTIEPSNSVFVTFKATKPKVNKPTAILCDNANRYSYRGKYVNPAPVSDVISFKEYLRLKDEASKGSYSCNGTIFANRNKLQQQIHECLMKEVKYRVTEQPPCEEQPCKEQPCKEPACKELACKEQPCKEQPCDMTLSDDEDDEEDEDYITTPTTPSTDDITLCNEQFEVPEKHHWFW